MTDHDDVTDPSPDLDVPLAASATVPGLCTRCYAPLHGFLLPHYADWTRRSQLIDPEICVLTSDDVSSYFSPHPTTPHLCASCVPSEPSADTQTPSLDEPRHPGHPSFSISPSTEGSHAGAPLASVHPHHQLSSPSSQGEGIQSPVPAVTGLVAQSPSPVPGGGPASYDAGPVASSPSPVRGGGPASYDAGPVDPSPSPERGEGPASDDAGPSPSPARGEGNLQPLPAAISFLEALLPEPSQPVLSALGGDVGKGTGHDPSSNPIIDCVARLQAAAPTFRDVQAAIDCPCLADPELVETEKQKSDKFSVSTLGADETTQSRLQSRNISAILRAYMSLEDQNEDDEEVSVGGAQRESDTLDDSTLQRPLHLHQGGGDTQPPPRFDQLRPKFGFPEPEGGWDSVQEPVKFDRINRDFGQKLILSLALGAFSPGLAALDTGAARHVLSRHVKMTTSRPGTHLDSLLAANGGRFIPEEVGDVYIRAVDPETQEEIEPLVLRDACKVNNSPLSLVSMSLLAQEGCQASFEKDNSYLRYNGRKYPLLEENGLFFLRIDEILGQDFVGGLLDVDSEYDSVKTADGNIYAVAADLELLHARLGHNKTTDIKVLVDRNIVSGIKIKGSKDKHSDNCTCPTCMRLANRKSHVPTSSRLEDSIGRVGQRVSIDLIGKFPESVIGGYKYSLVCVDHLSRMVHCFMLKTKESGEVIPCLRMLIDIYRAQGHIIQEFRSDNGSEFGTAVESENHNTSAFPSLSSGTPVEFRNSQFDDFCREVNIKHTLTPPYAPAFNSVVESANGSLKKRASSMLYHANLSASLWPQSLSQSAYIRNRLPVKGYMNEITPIEIFSGLKADLRHIKVFGCDAYESIPVDKKEAADENSTTKNLMGSPHKVKRWIHVGHSEGRQGWRVLDIETGTLSTRFNLVFDEAGVKRRRDQLRLFDQQMSLYKQQRWKDQHPLVQDDFDLFNKDSETVEDALRIRRLFEDHDRVHDDPSSTAGLPTPFPLEAPSDQHGTIPTDFREGLEQIYDESKDVEPDEPPQREPDVHQAQREPQDEDDPLIIHDIADSRGPLSDESLRRDHAAEELSKAYGCRPLRKQKPFVPVPLSKDDYEFLERAQEQNFIIEYLPMAKKRGNKSKPSDSYVRYQLYSTATTLGEAFRLVASANNKSSVPKNRRKQVMHADILNDFARGFIRFPGREAVHPTHYVNAQELADRYSVPICGATLSFTSNKHGQFNHDRYRLERYIEGLILDSRHAAAQCLEVCDSTSNEKEIPCADYLGPDPKSQAEDGIAGQSALSAESQPEPNFSKDQCRENATSASGEPAQHDYRLRGEVERAECIHPEPALAAAAHQSHDDKSPSSTDEGKTPTRPSQAEKGRDDDYRPSQAEKGHDDDYDPATDRAFCEAPDPDGWKDFSKLSDPRHKQVWLDAMQKEWSTLMEFGAFKLVKMEETNGERIMGVRWVLRKKFGSDGKLSKAKARLVAQGWAQVENVHFEPDELYASTMGYSSFRLVLSIACSRRMHLHQRDVTAAYIQSHLEKPIFCRLPPPYQKDGHALALLRGLYGLKQSGYLWTKTLRHWLVKELGFTSFTSDQNIFEKKWTDDNGIEQSVILASYVDDLTLATSSTSAMEWFDSKLEKRFPTNATEAREITVDNPGWILSTEVRYDRENGVLELSQSKAIEKIAEKFGVDKLSKYPKTPLRIDNRLAPVETGELDYKEYLSLIGSLLHVAQVSRCDVQFAVSFLARFGAKPSKAHFEAGREVAAYLYNTRTRCIRYTADQDPSKRNVPMIYDSIPNKLRMAVDADLAGTIGTARSTTGYLSFLNGGVCQWSSKKQVLTALSSTESELIGLTEAVKEALYLRLFLKEFGLSHGNKVIPMHEDNSAAIEMSQSDKAFQKARHYKVRLSFVQENCRGDDRTVNLIPTKTDDQVADGLTKDLQGHKFIQFRDIVTAEPILTSNDKGVSADEVRAGEQRGVIGEAISLVSTAQTGSLHRTSGGEGYALAHRNASSKLDDNTPGDHGITPRMSELIRTLIPVTAGEPDKVALSQRNAHDLDEPRRTTSCRNYSTYSTEGGVAEDRSALDGARIALGILTGRTDITPCLVSAIDESADSRPKSRGNSIVETPDTYHTNAIIRACIDSSSGARTESREPDHRTDSLDAFCFASRIGTRLKTEEPQAGNHPSAGLSADENLL